MKVTITKVGTYYLTRVWMSNPHQPLNKYDSPAYGSTLYRPSALLSKAVSKYNLTNKALVGFNASGFYLKNSLLYVSLYFHLQFLSLQLYQKHFCQYKYLLK